MDLSLIIDLIIIVGVLIFIAVDKKDKLLKLANAFMWLSAICVAFCVAYIAHLFGIVKSFPTWTPIDFLSVAMICYLISVFVPISIIKNRQD